jgi:hypothetical protein
MRKKVQRGGGRTGIPMVLSGSLVACAFVAAVRKMYHSNEKHDSFLRMGNNKHASLFA